MNKNALLLTIALSFAVAGYSQTTTDNTPAATTDSDSSSATAPVAAEATETDTVPASEGSDSKPASVDSTNNATGNPLFKNNAQDKAPESSNNVRQSQPADKKDEKQKHKKQDANDQ